MATYVGQRKRATATLKIDGVLASGTTSWQILSPDGHPVTAQTANPSTGIYTADFTCDEPGRWVVRFVSTGSVTAAQETTVDVAISPFYPAN